MALAVTFGPPYHFALQMFSSPHFFTASLTGHLDIPHTSPHLTRLTYPALALSYIT